MMPSSLCCSAWIFPEIFADEPIKVQRSAHELAPETNNI